MAIYHLSTKPVSRSSGRTATASIAYRAGIAIKDDRTGKEHDYTKRSGVVATQLHTPNNLQIDRSELWNLAEATETRKNSRTAREIVVNLPHELPPADRRELVNDFAKDLADKYGIAVDVAIHTPDKEGDNRNHHAHIMLTTRKLERLESGRIALTDKSQLEMSNTQLKERNLPSAREELKLIRKQWADMTNERLEHAQIDARIDHRSHAERGLDQLPTKKLGWEASALERKGIRTETGDYNRTVKEYNDTINEINYLDEAIEKQKEKLQAEAVAQRLAEARRERATQRAEEKAQRRQQEQKQIANTAPTPKEPAKIDTLKTELSITDKRQLLKSFHKHIDQKAEALLSDQLKQIRENAKPRLAEIEKIKAEKPAFLGKKQWQQKLDSKVEQYQKIKEHHDSIKAQGVTKEIRTDAMRAYYLERPEAYDAIVDVQQQLKEHDQLEQQQRQAEIEQRQQERSAQRADRSNDKGIDR